MSLLSEYEVTENQLERLGPLARADYFMLSDQDDVWLPQKARMLSDKMKEMEGEPGHSRLPLLVHSDLTVTDEELRPIADSFFRYQKISPERTRLPQLLVQNNVTGGAVMLSRGMLPYLKEIPGVCLMHDAWLALIASCFGEIGWVDRPLYYYRQHGGNTLGAEKGDNLESVRDRVKDGSSARENYRKMFGQADCFYQMFGSCLNRECKWIMSPAFAASPAKAGAVRAITGMVRAWGRLPDTLIFSRQSLTLSRSLTSCLASMFRPVIRIRSPIYPYSASRSILFLNSGLMQDREYSRRNSLKSVYPVRLSLKSSAALIIL